MNGTFARFLAEALDTGGRSRWSTDPILATGATPGRAVIDGRERLLLCTNDYLGLAADPRVVDAAREALETYGFGSRAARSLTGDTDVHHALEVELADFKGTESALLFGSGFSCNVSVVPALSADGDLICSDELNHASIVDGCRLSAARIAVYQHGNPGHLEQVLQQADSSRKRLIVTDAVFSMDGDVAPLPEIVDIAERYDAVVMLDEAHATGVLGARGKGTLEHFGLPSGVPVLMGTLGKALGAIGGFVAGSRDLVDYLARSARAFVFTTSLPPAAAAAALTSLRLLRAEPERVARLWENARRLHAGLSDRGLRVEPLASPIIPVFLDSDDAGAALSRTLYDRGVVAQPIGAPYVPPGTSRLRLIATAAHTADDIDRALDAFVPLS